jgi:hypothetical protein
MSRSGKPSVIPFGDAILPSIGLDLTIHSPASVRSVWAVTSMGLPIEVDITEQANAPSTRSLTEIRIFFLFVID